VDNITRALPLIIDCVEELKDRPSEEWKTILTQYDNKTTLKGVLTHIAHRMEELARRE